MSARLRQAVGLLLVLAALAGCGVKGDPVPPETEDRSAVR